jgi:Pectate lyase superfamily protein
MTGNNVVWFDRIAGRGGLASTPGHPNRQAAALVFGYWQAGDGGGGDFYWDPISEASPDGGTVFGTPDRPRGRWIRLYGGPLNVRWFGAKGDGVAPDTEAINAAIGVASAGTVTATVYFPGGVYMTTGITLNEFNSGITLRGEGTLAPSQGVGPPTIGVGSIIRLCAEAQFLLKVMTTCFRVENLWWDGNQLASDVVQFNYLTTQGHFENCLFTGAVVTTGYIHHYVSTPGLEDKSETDNLSFHRCVLIENRSNWNDRAAACIHNENPEAFQIEYEDCYFASASVIAHFTNQGSCDFYNGQMFNWTIAAIRVETYCEPFHVENIYNERDNAPFFQQVLNAGISSARSITMKDCQLNGATPIVFIGTQSLTLINVIINADITVNPDPTWGVYRLTSVNTTFIGGDFTGTGYPNAVDEIGTAFYALSSPTRSRIVGAAAYWNDTGKNPDPARSPTSYDEDGLALATGNGTPTKTTVLGDVHWIQTLTADRSYILDSSGVVNGSQIRVSRLGAPDPFTATIKGGVGGGGTAIALSNAGLDTITWVDWLWDAAGGGWIPVAQGRT